MKLKLFFLVVTVSFACNMNKEIVGSKSKIVYYRNTTNCLDAIQRNNDTLVSVNIYNESGYLLENIFPKYTYLKDSLFCIRTTWNSRLDTNYSFNRFFNGRLYYGFKNPSTHVVEYRKYPNGSDSSEIIYYNGKNNYIKLYSETIDGVTSLVEEYYKIYPFENRNKTREIEKLSYYLYGRSLRDTNGIKILTEGLGGSNDQFCDTNGNMIDTCKKSSVKFDSYKLNLRGIKL